MTNSFDFPVIEGEGIKIEETPFGCIINDKKLENHVIIRYLSDADLVIESLQKMKKEWGE